MSELVPMETRQITYDASKGDEIWRCHVYLLKKGQLFPVFFMLTAAVIGAGLFVFKIPVPAISEIVFLLAFTFFAPIFLSWLMVRKLVSKPRLCTTTISEAGVRDFTDKINDTKLTWNKIDKVQIEEGNVYFLSRLFTNVYIPAYAFDSYASAHAFYTHAQKLWSEAREIKSQRLASWAEDDELKLQADTLKQLEQFENEEEEMWKKMEDEHRNSPKPD